MIDLDLSNDARTLIELARDAHHPGDADRARVRAALASQIGVAAGLGLAAGLGTAAHGTAATVGAGAGGGVAVGTVGAGAAVLKVLGAAVIVSATVVGATVIHQARRAPIARASVAANAPAPSSHRRTVVGATAAPQVSTPASLPTPAGAVPRSGTRVGASAAKMPQRVHETVAAAPAVADEASLVHAGVLARRSGQPARALELLEAHARLYPEGVLAEERDGERALALADLGRVTEARAAIARFLEAHPASPLAARLRARARLFDAGNP